MKKQEAIKRLDALDAEAKALRAIIEAKKEPRGLCWVWDDGIDNPKNKIEFIKSSDASTSYKYRGMHTWWRHAIPLTEEEMSTYRGRWE